MWKMALILVMTALAIFFAHRALEAPVIETGFGAAMEILDLAQRLHGARLDAHPRYPFCSRLT